MMRAFFGLVVSAAALMSCDATGIDDESSCTDIGCRDGFSLTARSEDGTLPGGLYRFTFEIDGVTTRCSLDSDQRIVGSVATASCDGEPSNLFVSLYAQAECFEQHTEEGDSQSCRPLDGKWEISIGVSGQPKQVALRIERELGATGEAPSEPATQVVAEYTASPTYQETRPNGPNCEPVCMQANDLAPIILRP